MPFVDFADLKKRISIEQTAQLLGLTARRSGAQIRSACPACRSGGDRALVITPERGLYYCFAAQTGGDLIALTAHLKACSQNEAAVLISRQLGGTVTTGSMSARNSTTVPPQPPKPEDAASKSLQPLTYLEAAHPKVQDLGVGAETAAAFASGYAGKGIMRGRYAVPVKGKDGGLLAYVGIAVSAEQSPRMLFPNGFDPHAVIFNGDRVREGELYLVRDPLQVLLAAQNGVENVVAFLAPINAQHLEMLAALMDERRCDTVELY